jgi:hypothetical protein
MARNLIDGVLYIHIDIPVCKSTTVFSKSKVTLYQAWLTIWRKEYDDNTFLILNLLYHDLSSNFFFFQKCDLVIGPI